MASLKLTQSGKHLFIRCHLYLGIAQIAITPPPRTQTGTLGHFFSGAILPFFTFFFTIFSPHCGVLRGVLREEYVSMGQRVPVKSPWSSNAKLVQLLRY